MIELNLLENNLDQKTKVKWAVSWPLVAFGVSSIALFIGAKVYFKKEIEPLYETKQMLTKDLRVVGSEINELKQYEKLLEEVKQNEEKITQKQMFLKAMLERKTLNSQIETLIESIPQNVFLMRSKHLASEIQMEGKAEDYLALSTFVENLKGDSRVQEVKIEKSSENQDQDREKVNFTLRLALRSDDTTSSLETAEDEIIPSPKFDEEKGVE